MALEWRGVSHRYGRELALAELDLSLHPGQCLGFIGHNGAGKTTAMRVALGLMRPTAGTVHVDGHDLHRNPVPALAKLGGLIEVPGFHPSWSALDNLVVFARAAGSTAPAAKERAGRLLERVGLGHVGGKPVKAFSQGMRQRLGIALALVDEPRYLLLDEPGNGLDPEGLAELRRLLKGLCRDDGLGVLVSSHQLHEVSELCDRLAILKRGRLLAAASAKELLAGAHPPWRLEVQDADRARALLETAGVSARMDEDGEALLCDLAPTDAPELLSTLVTAGAGVIAFAPRTPSLEAIYLELEERGVVSDDPAVAETPDPAEPPAPGALARAGRVFRYEIHRWLKGREIWAAAALLPGLALLGVWNRHRQALTEGEGVVTHTAVNAYEAAGFGLQTALASLAIVAVLVASQSVAAERARGTLRALVQRPFRREDVILGKLTAHLVLALVLLLLIHAAAYGAAAWWFDFKGVEEILPDGGVMTIVPLSELKPEFLSSLWAPLLPLATWVSLGFLAGVVASTGTRAFGWALGLLLGLDLARGFLHGLVDPAWLPTQHFPSLLGDSSYVQHFIDVSQGLSNAALTAPESPLWFWLVFAVAASLFLFRRSSIR